MTAKITIREMFIEALLKRGETYAENYSVRYTKLSRAAGGYYFVGKHGALRFGKNMTNSTPCGDKFKQKLLEEIGVFKNEDRKEQAENVIR